MAGEYREIPGQEIPDEHTDVDQGGFGLSLEEAETPNTLSKWLALSESIYETSQDFYEQSLQREWEVTARHWNNQHDSSSKFNSESYKYRSRLFRPLTRTTERNSSASTAAAMFSNMDVIDIKATNPIDEYGVQGAAVVKSLLQYRLKHDVKWYLTAMGAWQDAFNYGPCVSYVHWDYLERPKDNIDEQEDAGQVLDLTDVDFDVNEYSGSTIELAGPSNADNNDDELEFDDQVETFGGMREEQEPLQYEESETEKEVVKDNLCIDLVPPEYFRADPACDWRDVINSSPYVIRLVPMYVTDVEDRMEAGDWMELGRAQILSAGDKNLEYDAVRRAREGDNRADSIDDTTRTEDTDFEVVFCHENFVRLEGREWVYWTLGTQAMLTEPVPLEDVYFHGKRPMVYGFSVIEAHKYAPNGSAQLIRGLQENVNDISNQRIDNLRLAMNKRYVVRRGSNVDLQALARNVPGGSVTADNPANDVQVIDTNDVTGSSYQEVDRLTVEANELAGSFSGSSVQSNRALNETVGGMQLLSEGANQLQEFDIRTWVESWVNPTLQLALQTLQAYENDETILAIAGQQGLEKWPEMDLDALWPDREDLWNMPMSLEVNVGLGATAPFQRINNLNTALTMLAPYVDPTRIKKDEITREVMAAGGYQDGSRFIMSEEEAQQAAEGKPPVLPPEVQAEQARIQGQMQLKQMELEARLQEKQMELAHEREMKMVDIAAKGDMTMKQLEAKVMEVQVNDKTKRDTVAVQEGTKQNEMQLRRDTGEGI